MFTSGFRFPKAQYVKLTQGKSLILEKNEAAAEANIELGGSMIASYLKENPSFNGLRNERTLIIIDDTSVGAGQASKTCRGFEKAFPHLTVHFSEVFPVMSRGQVPNEIKFPESKGKIKEFDDPVHPLYIFSPDLANSKRNPVFRRWQVDLRTEIKKQLHPTTHNQ